MEIDAERFQHVRRAAGRRYRAPAVLGDCAPGSRRNQRAGGGDVEGVRGIAPGAAGIDQMGAVGDRHLGGEFAHHLGRGGDLAHGLLLHAQADQDAGDLRLRDLAAHDLAHQRQHLVVKDFALLDQARQCLLRSDHGYFFPSRKFFSMSCPCSVSIDSGWNCTPCTASVLWRTPMISLSSVHAVISRQSGSVSRSITSEW